jgi:hypothetical protein
MDRDSAIRKVKACLKLSQSANENEAAAALRQAQKLMKQYGLAENSAEVQGVTSTEATAGSWRSAKRMPEYAVALAGMVAQVFQCEMLINCQPTTRGYTADYVRFLFVGIDAASQLAGYAYEVLRRQLAGARRDYLKGLSSYRGARLKANSGNTFAMGWVDGARDKLQAFATEEDLPEAVKARANEMTEGDTEISSAPCNKGCADDYFVGVDKGQKANIHRPMNGAQQPQLLSHG